MGLKFPIKNNKMINLKTGGRKKENRIHVVKIPLDYIVQDIPSNFPSMPQLYLELLENKKKVVPELRDKPYIPKVSITKDNKEDKILDFTNMTDDINEKEINKYKHEMNEQEREEKEIESALREERNRERERDKEREREREKRERDRDREREKRDTEREEGDKSEEEEEEREHRHKDRDRDRDRDRERSRDRDRDRDRERSRHPDRYRDRDQESGSSRRERRRESREERRSRTDASKRLDEILRTEKRESRPQDPEKRESQKTPPGHIRLPPNLSEIEKGQKGSMFSVNGTVKDVSSGGENEAVAKRELLFRFSILRKSYPMATIPEYTEYSDLETMKKSYDDTVRHIHLDSTVDSYKKYLVWGFMGVEYILGNWFKFDMSGFTQQQVLSMSSYERLLIELGEKSYVSGPSNWPVEIRLLAVIIMNAAFFIVSKMIMNKTGANIMGMMNSMNIQKPQNTTPSTSQSPQAPQKKKMQGPNVSLSDLDDEITPPQPPTPQQQPPVYNNMSSYQRTQTTQPIIPNSVGGDHSMPNLSFPKRET